MKKKAMKGKPAMKPKCPKKKKKGPMMHMMPDGKMMKGK